MINYENKIYSLIRKSIETKVIAIKPSIDGLNDEELANSKQIYIVTLDGKEYPITFNPNFNIRAVNKNGEILKIGCKLLKELIDNKIFNEFNILVVPEAEFIFSKDAVRASFNDSDKALYDPKKYNTLGVHFNDAEDSAQDYKIQLGFSIELEDNFEGSLHTETKYGKCSVIDTGEEITFDCKVVYNPNDVNKGSTFDEISFESDAIKNKYISKIKAITNKFLSNDINEKESLKRKLLSDSYEFNTQLKDYIDRRYEIAKKYKVEDIEMEFNILPVSISLNKVQKKKLTIVLKRKPENPNGSDDDVPKASFDIEVEPTKINNIELHCPNCGKLIDSENQLELLNALVDKKNNKFGHIVGCQSCGHKISDKNRQGELFHEDVIVEYLPEDKKEPDTYFLADCEKCDVDDKFYPRFKMIKYSFLANENKRVKSGYCLNDHKHKAICPNCKAIIAGTSEEIFNYLVKDLGGKKYVCCKACGNENKNKPQPGTPFAISEKGFVPYYISEISGRAFLVDKNKNNISFSSNNGDFGCSSEFVVCPKCGQLIPKTKYNKKNKCCEDCLDKNKFTSDITLTDEINKHIKAFYPSVVNELKHKDAVGFVTSNIYNEKIYRIQIGNKLLVVVFNENNIVFSKLSKK